MPEGNTPNITDNWGEAIQPGERPWQCVFNETHIKGKVFVSKPVPSNGSVEYIVTNGQKITRLPYVTKIIERLRPSSSPPICVQMIMTDDYRLEQFGNGNAHFLQLNFEDTDLRRQENDNEDKPSCKCKWKIDQ